MITLYNNKRLFKSLCSVVSRIQIKPIIWPLLFIQDETLFHNKSIVEKIIRTPVQLTLVSCEIKRHILLNTVWMRSKWSIIKHMRSLWNSKLSVYINIIIAFLKFNCVALCTVRNRYSLIGNEKRIIWARLSMYAWITNTMLGRLAITRVI